MVRRWWDSVAIHRPPGWPVLDMSRLIWRGRPQPTRSCLFSLGDTQLAIAVAPFKTPPANRPEGSALMRGLAALSIQPVMTGTGPLQLLWLDDLLQTVLFFLGPEPPTRQIVDIVGPRNWGLPEAVRLLRRWMRWPEAAAFTV